jgi:hypothetical protein
MRTGESQGKTQIQGQEYFFLPSTPPFPHSRPSFYFYMSSSTPHLHRFQLSQQNQDTATLTHSMERIESLVMNDAAWLLDNHIHVVSPEEFLQDNFGPVDTEVPQSTLEAKANAFHTLSFGPSGFKESSMYGPLVVIIHLQ